MMQLGHRQHCPGSPTVTRIVSSTLQRTTFTYMSRLGRTFPNRNLDQLGAAEHPPIALPPPAYCSIDDGASSHSRREDWEVDTGGGGQCCLGWSTVACRSARQHPPLPPPLPQLLAPQPEFAATYVTDKWPLSGTAGYCI
jgi:hypothetical protein